MIHRQFVCYYSALRVLKVLVKEVEEGETAVEREEVERWKEGVKNRSYSGKEVYSLEKVETIVNSSKAYAEDHLDFLRVNGECEFCSVSLSRCLVFEKVANEGNGFS